MNVKKKLEFVFEQLKRIGTNQNFSINIHGPYHLFSDKKRSRKWWKIVLQFPHDKPSIIPTDPFKKYTFATVNIYIKGIKIQVYGPDIYKNPDYDPRYIPRHCLSISKWEIERSDDDCLIKSEKAIKKEMTKRGLPSKVVVPPQQNPKEKNS